MPKLPKASFQTTEKIWLNGRMVDWQRANVHVLSHALHYGSGVFEGIRFYKTSRGPAIFRLKEHVARLKCSKRCCEYLRHFPCRNKSDIRSCNPPTLKYINSISCSLRNSIYCSFDIFGNLCNISPSYRIR